MFKACRICKRIVEKDKCDFCGSKEVSTSVKGVLIIYSTGSEIAKIAKKGDLGAGKYAIGVFQ
jgi:RNA polymerase subunit RPABC4/transcription elongation factor Spt4